MNILAERSRLRPVVFFLNYQQNKKDEKNFLISRKTTLNYNIHVFEI